MGAHTPHDLAVYVYGRIKDAKKQTTVDCLSALFQTMFLASLKTEEGSFVRCSIAYADPLNPDPDAPSRQRDPRWKFFPFGSSIEFTVANLSKIAFAADPSSTSIAVFPGKDGNLKMWGFFDQQGGYQSFVTHEADSAFGPPGLLQVQILSTGHLIVSDDLSIIAELNAGTLVEDTIDVFDGLPVFSKLRSGLANRIRNIAKKVEEEGFSFEKEFASSIRDQWISLLRRVLLRARGYGHGGAFLITDCVNETNLVPKYHFTYGRLPEFFENMCAGEIIHDQSFDLIRNRLDGDDDAIEQQLYLDSACAQHDVQDASEAIAGAVGLIASLSRVDGLVLLDSDFVVHGFGCEIRATSEPTCKFYQCETANPNKGRVSKLDLQRFGTRHRSMARYCDMDNNALGFVVSNDGPVRAFTRHGKRVLYWDNVRLTLNIPVESRSNS